MKILYSKCFPLNVQSKMLSYQQQLLEVRKAALKGKDFDKGEKYFIQNLVHLMIPT